MGLSYLMDTNVIIDYTSKRFTSSAEVALDAAFNGVFHYSIISRIEVLGFRADTVILQNLEAFLRLGNQYYITDQIANQTILIRKALPKLKIPDAVTAATALINNLALLTHNLADFRRVQGLTITDPYTL